MFDAWKSLETGVLIEVPRRELPGFREYNDSAFDDFGRWATTVYSGRGSRHCYEIKFPQAITLQTANCAIQPPDLGEVIELPQVGGLHHRYERRVA
jgi:hypothetical protein